MVSSSLGKDIEHLCRTVDYKSNINAMDITSTNGVASVKKVELTGVTKANGDKGYAKPDSSKRDILNLNDDTQANYLKNALGRQKPDMSIGSPIKEESVIDEELETDSYEPDIDELILKLKILL
ncbi:hypothetical protein VCHA53O466_40289 [Vibrio chagasii]|nr:hypothetical protein VCHA53O466_40289 [Vibrio chagasii]